MTEDRDARLCALLDGALGSAEAAELRAELARDPALAARLAELARVDAALRALPARPVPADLRARLQAKLEAEATLRPRGVRMPGGPPARWRRQLAWGATLAAAAAAAALVAQVGVPWRDEAELPGPPVAGTPSAPADPAREGIAGQTPAEMIAAARESRPELVAAPPPQDSAAGDTPAAAAAPVEPIEIASAPTPPAEPPPPTQGLPQPSQELAAADPRAPEREAPVLAPEPVPQLLVDVSDEEAAALEELELEDAGVVAVLDLLDDLDDLEAGAS